MQTVEMNAQGFFPGMGQAVAERTILRKIDNKTGEELSPEQYQFLRENPSSDLIDWRWETWDDVASRVALGNTSISGWDVSDEEREEERSLLESLLKKRAMITSGRHLQHGDANQNNRNMEVFTNCSTASTSFASFYMLLNGSGVGRCYDEDMTSLVDWSKAPHLVTTISASHPDYDYKVHTTPESARHMYPDAVVFRVPDSREGWAAGMQLYEMMTYEGHNHDEVLVLDFTPVRGKNNPIGGMQNRPSSGPAPLMEALERVAKVVRSTMPNALKTLYIDHFMAECVLVGGARRSARIAVMHWLDNNVFDFIRIKQPLEFRGKKGEDVLKMVLSDVEYQSFLWSANNSVAVDKEFWFYVLKTEEQVKALPRHARLKAERAHKVFEAVAKCSYYDGTGEPAFLNVDRFVTNEDQLSDMVPDFMTARSGKYDKELYNHFHPSKGSYDCGYVDYDNRSEFEGDVLFQDEHVRMRTEQLYGEIHDILLKKDYAFIVNPCGEIVLLMQGGFCVIGDLAPFFADSLDEVRQSARAMVRFLIRTNMLPSSYRCEVLRTNRIGVSLTGVFEFAWRYFGVGYRDLLQPLEASIRTFAEKLYEKDADIMDFFKVRDDTLPEIRAAKFWCFLDLVRRDVIDEADSFSKANGLNTPHTALTIKPAGTTSKLFGLTEGAHLPSMAQYMRWVQFRSDDPLVVQYQNAGYQTRELKTYSGTTIVGFPTALLITQLGIPQDQLVTAGEASMEEQFLWLRLLENFWLGAGANDDLGNQISYTLKYTYENTSFDRYMTAIKTMMPTIRACSVMPQIDGTSYEYQPEQPMTKAEYEHYVSLIREEQQEEVDRVHVECVGNHCPIDFEEEEK